MGVIKVSVSEVILQIHQLLSIDKSVEVVCQKNKTIIFATDNLWCGVIELPGMGESGHFTLNKDQVEALFILTNEMMGESSSVYLFVNFEEKKGGVLCVTQEDNGEITERFWDSPLKKMLPDIWTALNKFHSTFKKEGKKFLFTVDLSEIDKEDVDNWTSWEDSWVEIHNPSQGSPYFLLTDSKGYSSGNKYPCQFTGDFSFMIKAGYFSDILALFKPGQPITLSFLFDEKHHSFTRTITDKAYYVKVQCTQTGSPVTLYGTCQVAMVKQNHFSVSMVNPDQILANEIKLGITDTKSLAQTYAYCLRQLSPDDLYQTIDPMILESVGETQLKEIQSLALSFL